MHQVMVDGINYDTHLTHALETLLERINPELLHTLNEPTRGRPGPKTASFSSPSFQPSSPQSFSSPRGRFPSGDQTTYPMQTEYDYYGAQQQQQSNMIMEYRRSNSGDAFREDAYLKPSYQEYDRSNGLSNYHATAPVSQQPYYSTHSSTVTTNSRSSFASSSPPLILSSLNSSAPRLSSSPPQQSTSSPPSTSPAFSNPPQMYQFS
jgi:hypothetical protein